MATPTLLTMSLIDTCCGSLRLVRARVSPRLSSRVDPEDVVQSAYRSFFRRAAADDIVLQRSGDLWRLLAAFTLNKLRSQLEHHTAQKRDPARELHSVDGLDAVLEDLGSVEPTAEQAAIIADELAAVLARLSGRQRAVLEGRLQGKPIEELAVELQCSARTVRRSLEHCRNELEQRLLENPEP